MLKSLLAVTILLVILNSMKLVQISIPCEICGKTTFKENMLCRFASGWNKNFQHAGCTPDYQHIFKDQE
tara:strand:- start:890 stop:1096 length:207 start_codon:yes stop_codon:yes gene_type:complete